MSGFGGSPPQPSYHRPASQRSHGDLIQVRPGTHSPVKALLLSLLCCCILGQVYNKQLLKAIVLFVAVTVLGFATNGAIVLAAYILLPLDAYFVAARLNRGEAVSQWQWF